MNITQCSQSTTVFQTVTSEGARYHNLCVGRRTSNAAVWGDTGRNPLAIKISKQVFSYFARLKEMSSNNDNCLVKHAFNEQRSLNMSWYSRINSLQNLLQSHSNQRLNFPSQLRSRLREDFKQTWNEERMQNRKLAFYNSAKLIFEPERYIDSNIGYKDLKRLSQFRMSSHKYNIETGRYGKKQTNILNRICDPARAVHSNDIARPLVGAKNKLWTFIHLWIRLS